MKLLLTFLIFCSCSTYKLDNFFEKNNTVTITGFLNKKTFMDLGEHLNFKSKDFMKSKEINIIIDSGGGKLKSAKAIIFVLNSIKKKLKLKINCLALTAMSGAMDILQLACDKRYVLKNSRLMQHRVKCYIPKAKKEVPCSPIIDIARFIRMSERTKLDLGYIMKKTKGKDWFISPNESIYLNIADEVVN